MKLHPDDNGYPDNKNYCGTWQCLVIGCCGRRDKSPTELIPPHRYCPTHMAELYSSKSLDSTDEETWWANSKDDLAVCWVMDRDGGTWYTNASDNHTKRHHANFLAKNLNKSHVCIPDPRVATTTTTTVPSELLKVYDCGFTSQIGLRVLVTGFYWDEDNGYIVVHPEVDPKPGADLYGAVYLAGEGYFNLYSLHQTATNDRFKSGYVYEVMEVRGEYTWLREVGPATPTGSVSISVDDSTSNNLKPSYQEDSMTGMAYRGVVVRSKTVVAGEGVTTGVVISEIVYETPKSFIAANAEMARAKILVDAKLALKDALDLENTLVTLEVKLSIPNV